MKILVQRDVPTKESVGSKVFVDGQLFCYGLEPPLDQGQNPHAIAAGTYKVVPHHSPLGATHWDHPTMPLVEGTPGRSDILIHPGNFPKDTEGCLLVGETRSANYVGPSIIVWSRLFDRISEAWADNDPIEITYTDPD